MTLKFFNSCDINKIGEHGSLTARFLVSGCLGMSVCPFCYFRILAYLEVEYLPKPSANQTDRWTREINKLSKWRHVWILRRLRNPTSEQSSKRKSKTKICCHKHYHSNAVSQTAVKFTNAKVSSLSLGFPRRFEQLKSLSITILSASFAD